MLCEYPAWGALSSRHAPAYRGFSKALTGFLSADANRKLMLVAPSSHEMKRRIALYRQDYFRSQQQREDAETENDVVINVLKAGGDLSGNHYKHWPVDEAPRYQMFLIGEEIKTGEKLEFVPSEAIMWFAPRNSDVKDPNKRKTVEWSWSEPDVPVLAWQTTDPYILNEFYECARFYVHRDCNVPCTTYEEFLGQAAPATI